MATLGGGLKATLGGEAVLRRGRGLLDNATPSFSGALLSAVSGR